MITVRFYEELNDYLPVARRKQPSVRPWRAGLTTGGLLEDLGVPPALVDLVLLNGESVGLDREVQDGDRVSVYPVFESMDISPLTRLPGRPLRRTRFAVSGELGHLTAMLREMGLDAVAREGSSESGRIVLSTAARPPEATHWVQVRSADPDGQIAEILEALDLTV